MTHNPSSDFHYFPCRIGSLLSGDEGLLGLLCERRKKMRYRRNLGEANAVRLERWLVELAERFSHLWECTFNVAAWDEHDALEFGVLTTSWGKCRPIPASYKAELLAQSRSGVGTGPHGVAGMVQELGRKATPKRLRVVRMRTGKSAQQKRQGRQEARAAKSQLATSHPEKHNFSKRLQHWDRYNYFLTCKSIAKSELRYSLAMDATDVGRKKMMNSTMCFPRQKVTLWLPPTDLGAVHPPVESSGLPIPPSDASPSTQPAFHNGDRTQDTLPRVPKQPPPNPENSGFF